MGGNTIFGNAVHFKGADLDFKRLPARGNDGRMKGLIAI